MSNTNNVGNFMCSFCDFSAPYDYYGNKPPFAKEIVLMEKAFVMKDPFSPDKKHLTIGGYCSICEKPVCVGQNCSIFYTKRFCMNCTRDNIQEFPSEIQQNCSIFYTKRFCMNCTRDNIQEFPSEIQQELRKKLAKD